ncbi:hypothetical protein LCGC14_2815900 [marine sediment metagenome]|uniref:MYM-type domain-containing protein n=1 Tax=marine sediment metagenome TaxID=412755 RepID=A0A0F9B9R3_9ZZZZ
MKEIVTIYSCDFCSKELSNSITDTHISHLSITFSHRSGWVELVEGDSTGWSHVKVIASGVRQFCNAQCLSRWIESEMEEDEGE